MLVADLDAVMAIEALSLPLPEPRMVHERELANRVAHYLVLAGADGAVLGYGGLWVQFVAKDKQKSSPRTLAAWGFALAEDFASPLQMADEVPLTLNFKELKAKYPKGKLEDIGFGDGSAMFTLPNKMRFIGVDEPDTVQAGQLTFCE